MKLRLAAHTVRLRILRSELASLEAGGSLRQTVRLAPGPSGSISYALAVAAPGQTDPVRVSCQCGDLSIALSTQVFAHWCNPAEIGIYVQVDAGEGETLNVILEKDFACLDSSEADNRDTFENPQADAVC